MYKPDCLHYNDDVCLINLLARTLHVEKTPNENQQLKL